MSKILDSARRFFEACETGQGWNACQEFCVPGATFSSQTGALAGISTLEGYCEWMAGLGKGPLAGCSYDLHTASWDESSRTALFFATFNGTHTGDGGPVPATGKATKSHYVYALTMNSDDKVSHMVKIWNAPWALGELGWT